MQPCPRSPIGQGLTGSPFTSLINGEGSCWREEDNSCSYCGSLNNDYFMERLERGDVEVGPTDKSYKVYVRNKGGETFGGRHETKFYFQHLTPLQMQRFVELANAGQIAMGYPGHFYTLPFFIRKVD